MRFIVETYYDYLVFARLCSACKSKVDIRAYWIRTQAYREYGDQQLLLQRLDIGAPRARAARAALTVLLRQVPATCNMSGAPCLHLPASPRQRRLRLSEGIFCIILTEFNRKVHFGACLRFQTGVTFCRHHLRDAGERRADLGWRLAVR